MQEVNGILVAAHELKGPLATLRQLAFSLDYAADREDLAKIKTEMVEVSDRALKQVEDLTKIARLKDGLFQLEPVSLRRLCDDVVSELDLLFAFEPSPEYTSSAQKTRNSQAYHSPRLNAFDCKYTNRTRLVTANRELLFSVIYNFCLNAAHYSARETRARLTLKDAGKNHVRLAVRDFGPSLPTDVFNAFNHGWLAKPTSISMRPGSSGLGLYIASQFSEYMHAPVGAIRHRDGTSFFVDLPVSHQASLFPC